MMKIGGKLRDLRIAHDLTQEDIANRSSLTKGFISQLERDLTIPGLDNLFAILEALDISPVDFFADFKQERVHYPASDRVLDNWGDGVEKFEYLVSSTESKHMEPAILTLAPGQHFDKDAHKGEEFGFVLNGTLTLQMNDTETYIVKKGDTFYCEGTHHHRLENASKKNLQVLWVSSPPAF